MAGGFCRKRLTRRKDNNQEMTEEKAKVAEVDGDMDALSQFTLKQL